MSTRHLTTAPQASPCRLHTPANITYVDFRDRWGTQKQFFRMAQETLISAANFEPNPFSEVLGPTSATNRPKTTEN